MLTETHGRVRLLVSSSMKTLISILAVLALALPAAAQLVEQAPLTSDRAQSSFGSTPAPTPFSLLDLSRIRWSHSYSVSYFSGGNTSGTMGILNTAMLYEFSPKLSLNINIGLAHNPGALWGDSRNNNSELLPGFLLDYHPSEKFRMSLGFQKFVGNYFYPYYYNRGIFSDW